MKNIYFKLITICTFIALASPAPAIEIGVRGHYWLPGLEGDVKVDGDDISGTKIDFASDLGINEESYPVIEAFAGIGKHHLSLSYYNAKYEGEKVLDEEIAFNGSIYYGSEEVTSKFDYSMLDFEYRYDLLDLENLLAGGSFGFLGKVKYIDGLVSLESDTIDKQEQDFTAPIPMVGAHLHAGILADFLEFRAQLAGIGYSGAVLYEGFADVSLTPYPFLDVHAGYRALVLDVDVDDVEMNLNISGPYIGISFGF
jgi:hypothetical protein